MVQKHRRAKVMGTDCRLDGEDSCYVVFSVGPSGKLSPISHPQVVLVVIAEIANAGHLQGMGHRVEPDFTPNRMQLVRSVLNAFQIPAIGRRSGERSQDAAPRMSLLNSIDHPLKGISRTVLDEDSHETSTIA
jgi:hypothetical protein